MPADVADEQACLAPVEIRAERHGFGIDLCTRAASRRRGVSRALGDATHTSGLSLVSSVARGPAGLRGRAFGLRGEGVAGRRERKPLCAEPGDTLSRGFACA